MSLFKKLYNKIHAQRIPTSDFYMSHVSVWIHEMCDIIDKIRKVNVISTWDTLPEYATDGSSGVDLQAKITEPYRLYAGTVGLIPTGITVAIPKGFELQIRPRSGLALKHMITVLNTPGTIDSDFRGEINVILMNCGSKTFIIEPGDRIAQAVLTPVCKIQWNRVSTLENTARGTGGYGHTGVKAVPSFIEGMINNKSDYHR